MEKTPPDEDGNGAWKGYWRETEVTRAGRAVNLLAYRAQDRWDASDAQGKVRVSPFNESHGGVFARHYRSKGTQRSVFEHGRRDSMYRESIRRACAGMDTDPRPVLTSVPSPTMACYSKNVFLHCLKVTRGTSEDKADNVDDACSLLTMAS